MVNVTDNTFSAEVLTSKVPVLVDLWAPWCKPCLAVAPTLDKLAVDFGTKIKVVKVNVDDTYIAEKYNVQSLPTFLVFSEGKEVGRHTGSASYHVLRELALAGTRV